MLAKKPYAPAVAPSRRDPDALLGGSMPPPRIVDDDLEDDIAEEQLVGADSRWTHLDFGNLALLICAILLCAFSFYSAAAGLSSESAIKQTAAAAGTPSSVTKPDTQFSQATTGIHYALANLLRTRFDLFGTPVGAISLLLVFASSYALFVASRRRQPGFHGLEPIGPAYLKLQYVFLMLSFFFLVGALAFLLTFLAPLQTAYTTELAYRAEQLQVGMPVPRDEAALEQQQEQSRAQAMLQAPLAPMRVLPLIHRDVFVGLLLFNIFGLAYAMLGNLRARWEQTPSPMPPKILRACAFALLAIGLTVAVFNSIILQSYSPLRAWPFISMVGIASWTAKIAISALLISMISPWGRETQPCSVNWFEPTLIISTVLFVAIGLIGLFGMISLADDAQPLRSYMIANAVFSVVGGFVYMAVYWAWLRWRTYGDVGSHGDYAPIRQSPEGISLAR